MTWQAPTEYPNLSGAPYIAFDLETKDPNLSTKGPGGARGDGYVLGYAIAASGFKGYFPLRHPEGNMELEPTLRWLRDTLGLPCPKIGANILYDMEWAQADGVPVAGPKYDIQIGEFLLDEERKTYKLDALGEAYFAEGKNEMGLAEAVRRALGKKIGYIPDDHEVKENLWRLPAVMVGDYAEQDADLTLRIFEVQEPVLKAEELWPVFQLEAKTLDVLLAMRFKGVPVDVERAIRVREQIQARAKDAQSKLFRIAGKEINPRAPTDLVEVCGRLGLSFPRTEKGSPSFTAPWMQTQSHEFWGAIIELKQLENAANNHVEEKIINLAHNGKLFPSFHPVRKEKEGSDGMAGTRKGRFSSSNPNVQQIPSRHPYLAPLIRSCFVPEPGKLWAALDANQQEPRFTVHYAYLMESDPNNPFASRFAGASIFRERYITDPVLKDRSLGNDPVAKRHADMHSITAELAQIDRGPAKTINLGLSYGMGKDKCAASLGVPLAEAVEIMRRYNDALPFIKALGDRCSTVARERGYIRTVLGRKCRFPLFGPSRWTPGVRPLRQAEAIREFGPNVNRWFVHTALNNLVQGSGGDWMKQAMVDAYAAGYVGHITEHDALMLSVEDEKEARKVGEIMENCIKISVPMRVDLKIGPSWGEAIK